MIHVIVNNELTTPNDLPADVHAELMARPYGNATVGEYLAQGFPICMAGDWVIPNPVFTSAGLVDPAGLTYSTGVDDHENPTARIEARDANGDLVHSSGNILIRKGILVKDPQVFKIGTEYGEILNIDLEGRNPTPKVQEYWKELTVEQVAAKAPQIEAELAAVAAGNGPEVRLFETRDTAHGVKTYQLVQRSAIA